MDCGRETVPWAEVAAVLAAGKFCGQASELGVAEEWFRRTALEDLSGIAPELIPPPLFVWMISEGNPLNQSSRIL
jgi:hypothetical protein